MSTFIATSCCEKLNTKCLSGTLYNKEDKEVLVTKLNSRISQLEKAEKEFELLNNEFKQLENDVNLLNQAKLRLEYEMKQRDESYKKRYKDLEEENENLKNALNDKMCVNKKLFDEKLCLESHLKSKKDEITDLTNKLNNLNNRVNSTEGDKNNLQNTIDNLNQLKSTQKDKIAELFDDNKKLAKLCQQQEHSLLLANEDKASLNQKLNEDNAIINNLNSKIRIYTTNLNNLQNKLEQSNEVNLKLKKDLNSLQDLYKEFDKDNQTMINELNKEHAIIENEENNTNQLCKLLSEQKNKLRCLNEDYICIKNLNAQRNEEKNMFQMENDKLEKHMLLLTKQNEDLSQEIDNVIKDDNQMKNILNRCDRMSTMLKTNENIMYQMPQNIYNTSQNCYGYERNQMSPNRTYNRMQLSQNLERPRFMSPKLTYARLDNDF